MTADEAKSQLQQVKMQQDLLAAQADLLTLKSSNEADTEHYRKRLEAAHKKVIHQWAACSPEALF